jgi:hypothetical protein
MIINHPFPSGTLCINISAMPFYIRAEFTNLVGDKFISPNYTSVILAGCKVVDDNGELIMSLDKKISFLWSAVLKEPKLTARSSDMITVTIRCIHLYLARQKVKVALMPIEEAEEVASCGSNSCEYTVGECADEYHVRCETDVRAIESLSSENKQLREEINLLRKLLDEALISKKSLRS